MTKKQFSKGEVIFREGDMGDTLYQINKGTVAIYAGYGESDEQKLTEYGEGNFFGEMAVIEAYPRSATAVAVDDVEVLEIECGEVGEFFKSEPDRIIDIMKGLGGRLRDLTDDYNEVSSTIRELGGNADVIKTEGFMDKIRKFASVYKRNKNADKISEETLRKLSQSGHADGYTTDVETYKKGTVIFKEGEIGECMYDVHFGSVGIYTGYGTPDEKLITKLSPDEFFGELGMLDNVKRSATAVTLDDDTTIETISAANLKDLFTQNPPKVEMILEHLSYRLRRLTKEYMNACSIASRVSDADGNISDSLKKDVVEYSEKLYD